MKTEPLMPVRVTCQSCGKEFTRIVDETKCGICSDPIGFERFCKSLDKKIRERSVEADRETKARTRRIFEGDTHG